MARAKILSDTELEDADLEDYLKCRVRRSSRRQLNALRAEAYPLLDAARNGGPGFSVKELTQ